MAIFQNLQKSLSRITNRSNKKPMTNPHSVLLILIKLPESFRRHISQEKEARSIAI
ncbi:hypothetical protein NC651_020225 [Populus alba x Populus x berolinensis]|nr:hypothetical protein NC651_020225 [Populus alba x Populus x berolinensis]